MIKRLWRGQDPTWWPEHETSMELERRALGAGLPIAIPVEPVRRHFGWATRIEGHGVWRAYQWLADATPVATGDVDAEWFGQMLALLHTLFPLPILPESEWRWLGVYALEQWRSWLDAAYSSGRGWAEPVEVHLEDIEAVTSHIRNLYARSSDYLVSHRDFGPWNVLRVTDRLVLIDWENAGPTTATVELGRAVLAFGGGDPNRMRRLIDGYRAAGGVITGRIQDLFSWELTQHLSQLTERVRISVGDLDPEDDPVPIWVDPSTIDHDITAATTSLRAKADELAATASQL
jgi:hypothetical protein